MLALLYSNRDTLQEPETLRKYGFLYLGYDVYYWECVKRLQAFAYGAINNAPLGDQRARLTLYALLAGGNAIMHILVSPYDDRKNGLLDTLETYSLCSIFITMVLLQLIVTFLDSFTLAQQMTILGLIVFVNALFVWKALYYGMREFLFHQGHEKLMGDREARDEERAAAKAEREEAQARADERERKRELNQQRLARLQAQGKEGEVMRELEEEEAEEEEYIDSEYASEAEKKNEKKGIIQVVGEFVSSLHPSAYMGRVVTRKAKMETRVVLVETGPRSVKTMFVARMPKGIRVPLLGTVYAQAWGYVCCNRQPRASRPLVVTEMNKQFITSTIILKYMDDIVKEHKWENLDGDLYQFAVRVLIAFVQRQRFLADTEKFPRVDPNTGNPLYDYFYEQPEDNETGEPVERAFDGDGDEVLGIKELMNVPTYKYDFIQAQKYHFAVHRLEDATWGYKTIDDDISFISDELFRAYQDTNKMGKEETRSLFEEFQRALQEAVEADAAAMGQAVNDAGEDAGAFGNPNWDLWEKKGKALDLSHPHTFLPSEYDRPQGSQSASKEPTSPLAKGLLDIARTGKAAFDSSEVVENIAEEQQEAALNPIDITLQDLQKWRDTHEKRVAEMRMEAAIEAEEAQQASAVAVPGFEWTGLTGVDAAPAPDGLVAVTVEARGPLGVEVEWAVPPRFVVVTPGSIAHRAGLRAGDELAQIDQADVRDWPGDRIAPLLGLRPLNLRVIRAAQLADVAQDPYSPGGLASLEDVQLELSNSPPRAEPEAYHRAEPPPLPPPLPPSLPPPRANNDSHLPV
jgi:hypothetical protein